MSKNLHMIAFLLLVIGGINWLLFGVFGWEIGMLFGGPSEIIPRIIYILIGVAAVYELVTHRGGCKMCDSPKGPSMDEPVSESVA